MAPDAQFFSEGTNKRGKNDKIPFKINSTVFYHMQNRKKAPLTTATCLLKRETTSGINIFYYLC